MLSKVLSAREGSRAQAIVFAPVSFHLEPPRDADPETGEALAVLQQRIRQLENELTIARRESFDAGAQQGRGEILPVIERMAASIAEIANMRPALRRGAEKDVVHLAMLIARRVLHRELSMDPNALTALVRMAFDRLSRAESCRLVVHPQFIDAIGTALPAGQMARIRIESDPNCAPGTVIIHSDEGVIDASVDEQLAEIERGLTDLI